MSEFKWSQCLICGRWPMATVCEMCRRSHTRLLHRCPDCALSLPPGQMHRCERMGTAGPVWTSATARVDYVAPFDEWVKRLKFAGDWTVAQTMGRLMRECPIAQARLNQADWILPLPVSKQRLFDRGYNQSALLARHWCRNDERLRVDWLIKSRHTAAQAQTDRALRWSQLRASMSLRPSILGAIRGANVLLVDDVMTTGATLQTASECVWQAGASRVDVAVFARTTPLH